jgi:hypothetical protein
VFPVRAYGIIPITGAARRLIETAVAGAQAQGSLMSPTKWKAQQSLVQAGVFDPGLRLARHVRDKVMFYVLASGATLLTITFSCHSLASLARKLARANVPAESRTQFRNAL